MAKKEYKEGERVEFAARSNSKLIAIRNKISTSNVCVCVEKLQMMLMASK
jgi:hypothetical protein